MITRLRSWLRRHSWYVRVRRYGVRNTVRRWRYGRLARHTVPLMTRPAGVGIPCEVHILTSAFDWDLAVWSIKSFYHYSGVDWPLVIHDGGGIAGEPLVALQRHFPAARIVSAQEADRAVNARLMEEGFEAIARTRARFNLMRKVIDTALLASVPRILLLDSDVLFFARPNELLDLAQSEDNRIVLLRDYQDSYSINRADAVNWFGADLPTCIKSGLGVIPTKLIDLRFLERVFASEKIPLDRDGFAEQTALALLVGRCGPAYLPQRYNVVTGRADLAERQFTARHYVNPVK